MSLLLSHLLCLCSYFILYRVEHIHRVVRITIIIKNKNGRNCQLHVNASWSPNPLSALPMRWEFKWRNTSRRMFVEMIPRVHIMLSPPFEFWFSSLYSMYWHQPNVCGNVRPHATFTTRPNYFNTPTVKTEIIAINSGVSELHGNVMSVIYVFGANAFRATKSSDWKSRNVWVGCIWTTTTCTTHTAFACVAVLISVFAHHGMA